MTNAENLISGWSHHGRTLSDPVGPCRTMSDHVGPLCELVQSNVLAMKDQSRVQTAFRKPKEYKNTLNGMSASANQGSINQGISLAFRKSKANTYVERSVSLCDQMSYWQEPKSSAICFPETKGINKYVERNASFCNPMCFRQKKTSQVQIAARKSEATVRA